MTWQQTAVLYPDAEVELVLGMQALLDDRDDLEPVVVDQRVPKDRPARLVVFIRDGGASSDFRDVARIRCRVFAETYEKARDLARLVEALMPLLVDGTTILKVAKQSGPYEVPDESTAPQYLMFHDVHFRGGDLT